MIFGDYEWDPNKNEKNKREHDGISFEEAAMALSTFPAYWTKDPAIHEDRYRAIVMSLRARVLFVITTERGERDRIISARCADQGEEQLYAEHCNVPET